MVKCKPFSFDDTLAAPLLNWVIIKTQTIPCETCECGYRIDPDRAGIVPAALTLMFLMIFACVALVVVWEVVLRVRRAFREKKSA